MLQCACAYMAEVVTEQIFGVPFVVAGLEAASAHFSRVAKETESPVLVAHADVHVLTRILHEKEYGEGLRTFSYICPDGMPIVFLLRRKKKVDAYRLYGPDMMEWMWERGCKEGLRHFLLGGTEEAIALLQEKLAARFEGADRKSVV